MGEQSPEIDQKESDLAQIFAKELGVDLDEAQRIVDEEVDKRVAHIRHRRRLERMYDAALEELADAMVGLKEAREELTRIYIQEFGMSLDEARRRVRMECPIP